MWRFLDQSDNVIGDILSTLTAPLQTFDDSVVDAVTGASDFEFDNVRGKTMSIFFGVQHDKLDDAPELINLCFSQLIKLNLREQAADNPDLKDQCLLVLDDFLAIGRVGNESDQ
ncbi:type IV secretory system conjugative DNA transfer family protein [Paraburkholderia aspalathi]|uniref:type IV secretory system conjugative DNA transfer family protein n=1 Tax=Paraburkholderia aspalathi TaxID=1324617 RepID=UPI0038BC744B